MNNVFNLYKLNWDQYILTTTFIISIKIFNITYLSKFHTHSLWNFIHTFNFNKSFWALSVKVILIKITTIQDFLHYYCVRILSLLVVIIVKIVKCYLDLYRNIVRGIWGDVACNKYSIIVKSFTWCEGSGCTLRLEGEPQ